MVLHEETVRPVVILFYILCNAMAILLFMYPIMEEEVVKCQLLFKAFGLFFSSLGWFSSWLTWRWWSDNYKSLFGEHKSSGNFFFFLPLVIVLGNISNPQFPILKLLFHPPDERGDALSGIRSLWSISQCENYVAQDWWGEGQRKELWFCSLHDEKRCWTCT